MKRHPHPALIFILLTCFIFVSSALSAQAAQHSTHHAHHKATTHTSNICSWMCAAGQVLQAVDFELREPSLISIDFDFSIPSSVEIVFSRSSKSRAPPSNFLPTA